MKEPSPKEIIKQRRFENEIKTILKMGDYNPYYQNPYLDVIVDALIPKNTPPKMRKVYSYLVFDSLKRYGNLERKLGGPYQHHSIAVAKIYNQAIAKEGRYDFPGCLAAVDHDIPEEEVSKKIDEAVELEYTAYMNKVQRTIPDNESREIKKQLKEKIVNNLPKREEKAMIEKSLLEMKTERKFFLANHFDINENEIDDILVTAINATRALTRLGSQNYYQSFYGLYHQGVFGIPDKYFRRWSKKVVNKIMHREVKFKDIVKEFSPGKEVERAVTIRYCDALGNTYNLSEEDASIVQPTFADICYVIHKKEHNASPVVIEKEIKRLEKLFNESRKHHPNREEYHRLRGIDRVYRIFKNIILINLAREKNIRPKAVYDKSGLETALLDASEEEACSIEDHLCSYHIPPRDAIRIEEEARLYEKRGGFKGATKKSVSSDFDGITEEFFDAKVRGIDDRLDQLDKDGKKPILLRAARGFDQIIVYLIEDKKFIFGGLGWDGIKPK